MTDDDKAVEILAYLRGYAPDEVRAWTEDESDLDHDPDLASDLAWLTGTLRDYRESTRD